MPKTKRTLMWLNGWCAYVAALGALMVLAAYPPLDWPMRLLVDLVFWPLDGKPGTFGLEARLLTGIGGAVLIGWMLVLADLFERGLVQGDVKALRVAQTSLWLWFTIDSVHSITVGAWLNAVLNVVLLAGFLVPLWRIGASATGAARMPI